MELSNEERKKLSLLLKKDSSITKEQCNKNANSNILLIDGTNSFLRAWTANPAMNNNGDHTGGIIGFLKSVGYGIKLLYPTRCIIIFDGVGGSFKRKKIYPNYKEKRAGTMRLNRAYDTLSEPTTEEENRKRQYIRLMDYLQILPLNILSIDHVEADDVIAYLATDYFKNSDKVTIMSADRDFLQLCNDKIRVYSPTKKRLYGNAEVVSEYKIHPNNYVLYRALDGDDSDNIDGIEGAGPKTIVKCFPFLTEEKLHTIDEIINHAFVNKDKYKVYEKVAENRSIIERNVALMQLKETLLTTIAQLHCNECLETSKIPKLNRSVFMNLMRQDNMYNNFPNYQNWLTEVFNLLDSAIRQ